MPRTGKSTIWESHGRTWSHDQRPFALAAIALLLAVAGVLATGGTARADTARASGTMTVPVDGTIVINYVIEPSSIPGDLPGCNFSEADPVTLTIVPLRGYVSASPTTLTFTSCDVSQAVTFTGVAEGTDFIGISLRDSTAGVSLNIAPAIFLIRVVPAANTPPNVSVSGVVDGGTYQFGSVPEAVCTATDADDGTVNFPAELSAVEGPQSALGLGTQTATCTYTDAAGVSDTSSVTYTIVDDLPPVIGIPSSVVVEATGPDGTVVEYSVSASDGVDPAPAVTCQPPSGSLFPIGTTQVTCSATDSAGNMATRAFSVFVVDSVAPTVTCTGIDDLWHASDVVVTCLVTDAVGLAEGTDATLTLTTSVPARTETADAATDNRSVCDVAGNCVTVGPFTGLRVDKLAPSAITFIGDLVADGVYSEGQVPAAPTCTATDGGSGLASCLVTGYAATAGTHTLTATATDQVGNVSTATLEYTVEATVPTTTIGPIQFLTNGNRGHAVIQFEVFSGSVEQVGPFTGTVTATPIQCVTGHSKKTFVLEPAYDGGSGAYVARLVNWKMASCWTITVTTSDGTTVSQTFTVTSNNGKGEDRDDVRHRGW